MNPPQIVFGDVKFFAIGCRIDFTSDPPASNAVGEMYFWAGGERIGNESIISTLGIAANDLHLTLKWCGQRGDSVGYIGDKNQVIESVYNHAYVFDYEDETTSINRVDRFLVCTTISGNEWFDGWLCILISPDIGANTGRGLEHRDRLLIQSASGVKEVWLNAGEYGTVARKFLHWFSTASNWRIPSNST